MLLVYRLFPSMYTFPIATGGKIATKPTIKVLRTEQGKPVRLLERKATRKGSR
jgi:hypothetical protein